MERAGSTFPALGTVYFPCHFHGCYRGRPNAVVATAVAGGCSLLESKRE